MSTLRRVQIGICIAWTSWTLLMYLASFSNIWVGIFLYLPTFPFSHLIELLNYAIYDSLTAGRPAIVNIIYCATYWIGGLVWFCSLGALIAFFVALGRRMFHCYNSEKAAKVHEPPS